MQCSNTTKKHTESKSTQSDVTGPSGTAKSTDFGTLTCSSSWLLVLTNDSSTFIVLCINNLCCDSNIWLKETWNK